MFEHDALRRLPSRIPYAILIPMSMIVLVGILNLSSAAQATRPDLYLSQVGRFCLAVILLTVTAFIHPRIIRQLSTVAYLATIFLLVMVLLVGTVAKGAERWLVFGGLRIQPSDPAKLALILAIARYSSLYWPHDGYSILTLTRPLNISRPMGLIAVMVFLLVKGRNGSPIFSDQLLTSKLGMAMMGFVLVVGIVWLFLALLRLHQERFHFASFVAPLDIALLPFLLICVEPDLATGLIVLSVAGVMLLYVGIRKSSLIFGFCTAVIVGVVAYFTLLMDYQKQRILTFLNPEHDLKGDGYHAMQSIIAIGSGRIVGKGYNGGTQTQLSFLPENATDFVFSVWAEEWGFVACVFLLGLYLILLWSILKITTKVDDQFSQLLCIGVAANIFVHVVINVGMVTGLMPVAGVPLPLMSYGGSSLNITFIGIGLVTNVALWRGEK